MANLLMFQNRGNRVTKHCTVSGWCYSTCRCGVAVAVIVAAAGRCAGASAGVTVGVIIFLRATSEWSCLPRPAYRE